MLCLYVQENIFVLVMVSTGVYEYVCMCVLVCGIYSVLPSYNDTNVSHMYSSLQIFFSWDLLY